MIAAGIDGIENSMQLEDPVTGNAYELQSDQVAGSMPQALADWVGSAWVRDTFGQEVHDHYANMARVEIADFGKSVTDWERIRSFERI